MRIVLKIGSKLLADVRADLERPHAFAHERVGFIAAGLSGLHDGVVLLVRGYRPVADAEYLRDRSVGAMMGPVAIRKALQWAMSEGQTMLHVHMHGGGGVPDFSGIDVRENAKFVPDFFKVAPQCAHGAIVLSDDAARGQIWLGGKEEPLPIESFIEVGTSLRKWRPL